MTIQLNSVFLISPELRSKYPAQILKSHFDIVVMVTYEQFLEENIGYLYLFIFYLKILLFTNASKT